VLTGLSLFWFDRMRDLIPNHLISAAVADLPPTLAAQRDMLDGRIMIGQRAERIDIECVARGYLAGSGWAEYRRTGSVAGYDLPVGLTESEQLPRPLFTPALKNDDGHDENITPARLAAAVGADLAQELERKTLTLYAEASAYAAARGIILADTKFEFGYIDGALALIDELLTPDSSRFWDVETYEPGRLAGGVRLEQAAPRAHPAAHCGRCDARALSPRLRTIDRRAALTRKRRVITISPLSIADKQWRGAGGEVCHDGKRV
jgi:phosphoribosylaminoimidazole-succinocarboxamide synthase